MPNLNGTGPSGEGPITGRGMGSRTDGTLSSRGYGCRGYGLGQGRGMRMGFCPRYLDEYSSPKDEVERLKEDQKVLNEDLATIEKRLKDIKGSK